MLRRVSLVTCREHPDLPPDDRGLIPELARLGIAATVSSWDDPAVAWTTFDAIVLRSTWDYHLRIDEFLRWIEARRTEGAPLWNPAPLLLWNAHKSYLRDLERKGIPIAPTRFLPADPARPLDLFRILEDERWDRAIVKPAVSGGAHRTHLVDRETAGALHALDSRLTEIDLLVQEYLPEIESTGEWSLVYIDGLYSHAVRKLPASGDFRVQTELGGSVRAEDPERALLREADRVVGAVDSPWIYARVDGVESRGEFRLMELEVVEPSLFLDAAPDAARRFAAAIDRVSERRTIDSVERSGASPASTIAANVKG